MRLIIRPFLLSVLLVGTTSITRAESPQSVPRALEFGRVEVNINLGSGFPVLDRFAIERQIKSEESGVALQNFANRRRDVTGFACGVRVSPRRISARVDEEAVPESSRGARAW